MTTAPTAQPSIHFRWAPVFAVLAAAALHGVLLLPWLLLPATPLGRWIGEASGLAALVLPGALAGWLTRSRPLLVAVALTGLLTLLHAVAMGVLLGAVAWALLDPVSAIVQLAVTAIASVAAFRWRERRQRACAPHD